MDTLQDIKKVLLRGAVAAFVAKGLGALLAFAQQVVLARVSSIEDYGTYTYYFAWIMVAACFVPLGADRSAVRFVSIYASEALPILMRQFTQWAAVLTIKVLCVCVALLLLSMKFLDREFDGATLALVGLCALLTGINALTKLGMEILRGYKKVVASELHNMILRPLAVSIAAWAIFVTGRERLGVLELLSLNSVVGFLVLVIMFRILYKTIGPGTQKAAAETNAARRVEWAAVSFPLVFVSVSNVFLGRADVIMLGMLASAEAVGVYNAAARIAVLVGFPLIAVNAILAPMVAQLHSEGRQTELAATVKRAAWICFLASAAASIAAAGLAKVLLSFYGENFVGHANILWILIIGQLVSNFAGPVGYVLSMTGHQRSLAKVVTGTAVLNVALNFVLIPKYGEVGAAVASSFVLVLSNFVLAVICQKHLGVNSTIIPFPQFRSAH